ncbi:MAG: hypothetical protein F4144_02015 [Acidimicrobiaceae bacterium]|nr:hypothetical protein [Acidimicrobiaceae bacterium]
MAVALVAAAATLGLATTATAQSGFTDTASSIHRADIETLTAKGLFEGTECADEQFCPNKPAKRWAVAVWLVRALDGGDPPPLDESRFTDVDDEWWLPHVERLAQLGVTAGCRTEPRASFRTWCAETGVRREVAEAALAHTAGAVERAYQRSDLLAARRALMDDWARVLVSAIPRSRRHDTTPQLAIMRDKSRARGPSTRQ